VTNPIAYPFDADVLSSLRKCTIPTALRHFAILSASIDYPVVLADFLTTFAGGNANLAEQRRFRIRSTGFIEEVVTETDALGLVETRSRQTRSNKNKKKAQSTRTSKYAFVQAIRKSPIYQQYFSPDNMEVEQDLLQIPDVVRFALVRRNAKVANFTLVHCRRRRSIEGCAGQTGKRNMTQRKMYVSTPLCFLRRF